MYDIYIYRGATNIGELDGFDDIIPSPDLDKFRERIEEGSVGFLGLNLDVDSAKQALKLLMKFRSFGRILPVRYRDKKPNFTIENALPAPTRITQHLYLYNEEEGGATRLGHSAGKIEQNAVFGGIILKNQTSPFF